MTNERRQSTVAVFPLYFVQFPTAAFTLHIYEQRYRTMFADCLARNMPIAVFYTEALVHHSAPIEVQRSMSAQLESLGPANDEFPVQLPHDVGTILAIESQFVNPDGRALIQGVGGERIRLTKIIQRDPYIIGEWEPIPDVIDSATKAATYAFTYVYERYLHYIRSIGVRDWKKIHWSDDDIELSWQITKVFNLPPAIKQTMLTMNTNARMRALIRLLRAELKTIPFGSFPPNNIPPWSWN
jgi:Lon protease-like protein